MGRYILSSKDWIYDKESKRSLLSLEAFDRFSPSVLGLGDISIESNQVDAICAVFDLQGFTNCCKQVDPHLVIPEYLSEFLEWLFNDIKDRTLIEEKEKGMSIYAPLPFLAKFMGDGVLFLWDTARSSKVGNCNIVNMLLDTCKHYNKEFLPAIQKKIVDPPTALRCGIARGRVFSVGNQEDYVGPCINLAARLQKLSLLSFAFSRRGFNPEKDMRKPQLKNFSLKKVSIRGIGSSELIYVLKDEFDGLPDEEKPFFNEP